MDDSIPQFVSRRTWLVSGGVVLVLLLAIGAFVALRGRTTPLWTARHGLTQTTTP